MATEVRTGINWREIARTGMAWAAVIVAFIADLAINGGTVYGNRSRIMDR